MTSRTLIERAPKVLLHDHLDGGLRPETVIDLAAEYGYTGLPTTDVDDLATWFNRDQGTATPTNHGVNNVLFAHSSGA